MAERGAQGLGEWIGGLIGGALRLLAALWHALATSVSDFLAGLARGIGLQDPGLFTWVVLALGLFLVALAVRGFFRRAILRPVLLLALGSFLISTVVV